MTYQFKSLSMLIKLKCLAFNEDYTEKNYHLFRRSDIIFVLNNFVITFLQSKLLEDDMEFSLETNLFLC